MLKIAWSRGSLHICSLSLSPSTSCPPDLVTRNISASYWLDYYRGGKKPACHDHHLYLDNLVIATGKRPGLYTPPAARQRHVSDTTYDLLAITNQDTLSAASKRAIERYDDQYIRRFEGVIPFSP